MKKLLVLVIAIVFIGAACNEKPQESQASESSQEPQQRISQSSEAPVASSESQKSATLKEVDKALATEVVKTFGAEGEDSESLVTSVVSFYYNREGTASFEDITPYGYYGWFIEDTSRRIAEQESAGDSWGFEVYELYTLESGEEKYGVPANIYEEIVTLFFDVSVEMLRSDDTIYHAEQDAYWPVAGPEVGERPTVSIGKTEDDGEIMTIEVILNKGEGTDVEAANQEYRMILKAKHDDSNKYTGFKFISILPKE